MPTFLSPRASAPLPLRAPQRPAALLSAALALLLAPTLGAAHPAHDAQARRIEADVRFLADDLLEGREAATRGYDIAALYVAERLRGLGLEPAGEGGRYFQTVPLLKAQRLREGAGLTLRRDGASRELSFLDDFVPSINFNDARAQVEAPAVFVGQAVHAPELGHDDFAGVDLRGKIAVFFMGAPPAFGTDRRAHYSANAVKLRELAKRGAVGAVTLYAPDDDRRYSWKRIRLGWEKSGMRLRGEDGRGIDTFPELRVVTLVSPQAAGDLLGIDGRRLAQLHQAKARGRLRPFALPGRLALGSASRIEAVESRNVVAKLPGADPQLTKEHIVFSAHLDHEGMGTPVEGDAIYNGALDNALGTAAMLETAAQLAARDTPLPRSVLFVAVTAEEKGLLGAEWFATRPTVPADSLIANLNIDMPVLLAPDLDIVPIGMEHSSLRPLVEAAAKEEGVRIVADPYPEQNFFIRSDQYAFIRAGIPALYLKQGNRSAMPGHDGREAVEGFLKEHYHLPSDDVRQPIQYADVARLARMNARVAVRIAAADERPRWNAGNFFGEMFGTPATRGEPARTGGSDRASAASP